MYHWTRLPSKKKKQKKNFIPAIYAEYPWSACRNIRSLAIEGVSETDSDQVVWKRSGLSLSWSHTFDDTFSPYSWNDTDQTMVKSRNYLRCNVGKFPYIPWLCIHRVWPGFIMVVDLVYEPAHDKTYKMVCAPSEDSDQPGHPLSLISPRCPHEESLGP